MGAFINEIKFINRFILVISCFFFFPILPIGLAFGILWMWLSYTSFDKRSAFLATSGFLLFVLAANLYGYKILFHYFKTLLHVYDVAWDKHDLSLVLTVWYSSWANFKRTLLDFGLMLIFPVQGFALTNFFLLRSPEILHEVVKSDGVKHSDYRKAEKTADKLAGYSSNDGTLLGASVGNNSAEIITDSELSGHLFVAGTTGSGKTVTLKNFILSAIERGIPLIYVDGKGDQKLPLEIKKMCDKHGREFKLFEMSANAQVKYNPLSVGGFTELKDKIITMKTVDSSDGKFYQTAEGEYLQFLFKVLQRSGKKIDLYTLGSYVTMPKLFDLLSSLGDIELQNEARELKDRLSDKLDGLISDINTFIKSELGHLFDCSSGDAIIDLDKDIRSGAVIYFSLNDLNYSEYASRLGKLVINDLKSVFGRIPEDSPIATFGIFDEFTTYAGEQFTTILSRTRSKGLRVIIGSQSFDTIDKISPKLASDLIANCNTYIIHRQNSDIDAEKLADVIGKVTTFEVAYHSSANMNSNSSNDNNLGSSRTFRKVRENKVEPEKIQALQDGFAYVLRKKQGSKVSLVKIRFIKD